MSNYELRNYVKEALRYTLFKDSDQNNEYEISITNGGIVFIPIYPLTYVIDDAFYERVFTILNLALTPSYTMIRPLTMQIVNLKSEDLARKRGLFFPMLKGQPQRIKGTLTQLIQRYHQTKRIPLMDGLSWDFVKSPHLIVSGVSGSGKSYFTRLLVEILNVVGETIIIDPKASDLARMVRNKHNSKVVIPDLFNSSSGIGGKYMTSVINVLKRLENTMYQRQGQIYTESKSISVDYRSINLNPKFIIIDELAALMEGANTAMKKDFQSCLIHLATLGREAGIYLIISMQSARAEYLPSIVRDQASCRILLGRINKENAKFLFPEINEIPSLPIGGKGNGIISIAGDERFSGIQPLLTPTIKESLL